MAVKKEAAHDCKAECADLYKQLAALKKEVASLKSELKKSPKGGARTFLTIRLCRGVVCIWST